MQRSCDVGKTCYKTTVTGKKCEIYHNPNDKDLVAFSGSSWTTPLGHSTERVAPYLVLALHRFLFCSVAEASLDCC